MNTNVKSSLRWPLILSYLAIISLLMACSGVSIGTSNAAVGALQINDGVVEVLDEDGNWTPVAGDSTFELVGDLQGTDPWMVAGSTLQTNESTQIAEGLETGDLVRARGVVLEDGTWVAYSIEAADQQTDATIILIGVVDSVNPWVVNGTELNVTDTTVIEGDITPGMIVRVEILLLEDGTWEVLSIRPLGDSTDTAGCATIIATVVSVNGDQIQFLGWPTTITLQINAGNENDQENDNNDNDEDNENENDDENENEQNGNDDEDDDDENENEAGEDGVTLEPGQVVQAVVCVSDDGTLVIVSVIVLDTDDDDASGGQEKVLVCHKPDSKKGGHTLSIASPAVPAHLGHGDTMGPCP